MTDAQSSDIEEMFVQMASGVTSTPDKLTLIEVNPSTLYFSDRPERVVGHLTVDQFVDDWGLGPNSFESDPPNAVLTYAGPDGTLDDVVLELHSPHLDHGALSYSIDVLDGMLPAAAGACSLFIDPIGRPLSPMSVCGVRRREGRRMRRRMV